MSIKLDQLNKLRVKYLVAGLSTFFVVACGSNPWRWNGTAQTYCNDFNLSPEELMTPPLARSKQSIEKASQELLNKNRIQEAIWILATSVDFRSQAEQLKQDLKQTLESGEYSVIPMELKGSNPKQVFQFKNGVRGIFKPNTDNFEVVSADREVAAYELDQELNLNIVPMTVKRTVGGTVGSLQYFVNDLQEVNHEKLINYYIKSFKVFDYLIGNRDRKVENILLWDFDQRLIAIDNGGGFGDFRCGESQAIATLIQYDPELKTKISKANPGSIRARLSPYLEEDVIQQLIDNLSKLKN